MGRVSRVGSPVQGEWRATRARPESITATTPSMVTEVSATLVERITLGRSPRRMARSCSRGGRSPWSVTSARPARSATGAHASRARRISPAPGRKTSTSPSSPPLTRRFSADATCCSRRRSSGASRCVISTGWARPSTSMAGASRNARTFCTSRVALITTIRRPLRAPRRRRSEKASARSPCR